MENKVRAYWKVRLDVTMCKSKFTMQMCVMIITTFLAGVLLNLVDMWLWNIGLILALCVVSVGAFFWTLFKLWQAERNLKKWRAG